MSKKGRKNINKLIEANEMGKKFLDSVRNEEDERQCEIIDAFKKHLDNISFLFRRLK